MEAKIYIQNLKCGGCANTITKSLSTIEGISSITVNVEDSLVTFDYDIESKLNKAKDKLKALGYPEDGDANNLGTKAKSYVSCAIGKMK